MAVLVLISSVFVAVIVQKANCQECPGITKGFVNVIGTVGTNAEMSMEACQSADSPEYVAFVKLNDGIDEKRIWSSSDPDNVLDSNYDVRYPEDFTQKGQYELIFLGSKMSMAGTHQAKFLLGSELPKTTAVFVAVNSMAKENTCPERDQKKNAGDEIIMVCEVEFKSDGIVFPKLTWENVDSNDTHQLGNNTHNGKVRSEARFIASANTHNHNFTCKLRFEDDPDFSDSCTTRYNVQYRVAEINISPDPDEHEGGILPVNVGDVISCSANGNPSPRYLWNCAGHMTEDPDLTVVEEYIPKTNCSCTATNRIDGVDLSMMRFVSLSVGTDDGSVQPSTGSTDGWKIAVGCVAVIVVIGIAVGVIIYWMKCKYSDKKEHAHLPVPTSEHEEDVPPPGAPPVRASLQPTLLSTAPIPEKPWNPRKKPVPLPRPAKSAVDDNDIQDSTV